MHEALLFVLLVQRNVPLVIFIAYFVEKIVKKTLDNLNIFIRQGVNLFLQSSSLTFCLDKLISFGLYLLSLVGYSLIDCLLDQRILLKYLFLFNGMHKLLKINISDFQFFFKFFPG